MSDIGLAEKRIYHAALNGNNSLCLMFCIRKTIDNFMASLPIDNLFWVELLTL
jgi:hypothetical protein